MTFDPTSMLAFDLETTTNIPEEAYIVASALVTITSAGADAREMLANPGVPITPGAEAVHGISNERAQREGRPHTDVLRDTINAINDAWHAGRALIVFNGTFDLTVLRARDPEFTVNGLVIDPYVIDKAKDPYRKGKRTLGALCETYGIILDNAHEATSDALAAARLAWKLARRWPELTTMESAELMEQQAVWYYEQQTSLKKYFIDQGRDASSVHTAWPLRTITR